MINCEGRQAAFFTFSPDGSGEEVKIMCTFTQDPEPIPPPDVQWFTALLLRDPRTAVKTAPVLAMVAELLKIQ
jgi:hypothetical protein